jgi:hypothetical protein
MLTHLLYSKVGLEIEIPSNNATTLAPRFIPGLPDEGAAFREAVRAPVNLKPLCELVRRHSRHHAPTAVQSDATAAPRSVMPVNP